MFSVPQPLHAAVVHFPIVLVLLGAVVSLGLLVTRRWNLPAIAASLLALGAVGSIIAVATGKEDGEVVATAGPLERVLDAHEEWAERTRAFAIVAAFAAIGVLYSARWPTASRMLAVLTVAGSLGATWSVFATGHYGGQLVYRHGAGVNQIAATSGAPPATGLAAAQRKHRDDD